MSNSSASSGGLVARNYKSFRGVDFSNRKDEVSIYRSPDAVNVWKNYKSSNGNCIETRPDIASVGQYTDTIFGLFFYTYNGTTHRITHVGSKLYDNDIEIYNAMARHESKAFIYESKFYIKDGTSYLVYNGTTIQKVDGYIPTTSISRSPNGGGKIHEDVNLLTGVRKNSFVADGESKEYFVDTLSFDSDYKVRVWINDKEVTSGFTVTASSGKVSFTNAPTEPLTVGQDNVIIQFRKTIQGYRDRIDKCTLLEVFDNRVFFSGNPNYPNMLWHCSLEDPTYCSDLDYYKEGMDDSAIKAIVSGNNALWVAKEPSQTNTTLFYHNPTVDDDYGKVYPSTHSNISTGCVSTAINFRDSICFFSERGLEKVTGDITTEQVISHVSSLIDTKLLNEPNYKKLLLAEWEGYLLVAIDKHIYLADSREHWQNNDHIEYEWFYWEFNENITFMTVKDEVLYICCDRKIYILTDTSNTRTVPAHFCTMADEFAYPQMWKTTNKKASVIDVEASSLQLAVRTDNKEYITIGIFDSQSKGYIKPRIKAKKFKSVQLKFSSTKPFSLYSATLEAYIGNMVKR